MNSKIKRENKLIHQIAERFLLLAEQQGVIGVDLLDVMMSISVCHKGACPLDLEKLLQADDFNLCHDVLGIIRHLDPKTRTLKDCFLPRCAYYQGKPKR